MTYARLMIVLFIGLMFGTATTQAQNNLGLSIYGGSAIPTDDDVDNDDVFHGGGVNLRYFMDSGHVAIGAGVRYYGKRWENETFDASVTANVVPVVGMVEYYFADSKAPARPYIGAEVGVYNFSATTEVIGFENTTEPSSHFGVAPKAGVEIGIGEQLGIFGELGYNIVFDKEDNDEGGSPENADFDDVATKFVNAHLGVALRF